MRIARAHHRAAILENLHVLNLGPRPQFHELVHPRVHHLAQVGGLHIGDRQIVARRKAHHAANARLRFRHQQSIFLKTAARHVRLQRREIVVENECRCIRRVAHSSRALIARAQVTVRVVSRLRFLLRLLDLPLPRSRGTMRRHQHPLARQRIKSPVRILVPVEHGANQPSVFSKLLNCSPRFYRAKVPLRLVTFK